MKFTAIFQDQNEEGIESDAEGILDKIKKDNADLTPDQIEDLKTLTKKQLGVKHVLLSCPECERQDGGVEEGFLCIDCLQSVAVIHGKFKHHLIPGKVRKGDVVYRDVQGWTNDVENPEMIMREAIVDDFSESFELDVYDLNVNMENKEHNWIESVIENRAEEYTSVLVSAWKSGDMYILRCGKCKSRNMRSLFFISCPDCNKIYAPCANNVIGLRDKYTKNRETPCYMVNSKRGNFLVSKCDEKKNQIEGINAFKVYSPKDVKRKWEEAVFSYTICEE